MIAVRPRKLSTVVLHVAASWLVLTSGGCQSLVFLLAGDSGITGRVLGGGCGIIDPSQPPPDCGFHPLQTTFNIYDEDRQTVVTRGKEEVILQPREFRLLEYLMKHAGQVVTCFVDMFITKSGTKRSILTA